MQKSINSLYHIQMFDKHTEVDDFEFEELLKEIFKMLKLIKICPLEYFYRSKNGTKGFLTFFLWIYIGS